jgi:hypothetical protein
MTNITITMDETDFNALCSTSMKWHRGWANQPNRFEPHMKKYDAPPDYTWKMAYWVGDSWVSVMLVCAFLSTQNETFEILWDTVEPGEYVILTNYETESWRKAE